MDRSELLEKCAQRMSSFGEPDCENYDSSRREHGQPYSTSGFDISEWVLQVGCRLRDNEYPQIIGSRYGIPTTAVCATTCPMYVKKRAE